MNRINRLMKKDTQSSLPNSPSSFSPSYSLKGVLRLNSSDSNSLSMPTKETVIRKMKKITKIIQELYKAIKETKFDM